MADQVCSVVGILLTTVSTIMDQRGGPLGEVEKELQLLKIELSQMKALLENVDLIQDDPQSKVWISQVRDISYEIEDAIDEYAFRFAHPHSGGLIGHVYSTLNSIKNRSAHHNFAKKLQGINATVERISKAHHSYEAKYATAAPPKDSWRYNKDDEALYLGDSQQVGLEVPKQNLISELLQGDLEKIPPWIANLQKLKELKLFQSCLRDDPLDTLQQLPNLVDIYLGAAYEGESVCFRTGCFLKLEKLGLYGMRGLRWMRVEKGAMPFLRKLSLRYLEAFEELPFGVEHLRQLQELEIKDVGEKLTNVLKGDFKTSEECKSIAHIPFVSIH